MVRVDSVGDTTLLPGSVIDKFEFRRTNQELMTGVKIKDPGDTEFRVGDIIPRDVFDQENLRVESTGIIDYPAVCRVLAEQAQEAGAELLTGARVTGIRSLPDGVVVEHSLGEARGDLLVNCAGLHSDRIAALAGVEPEVRIVPFRGEYYELVPSRRHLVRGLVYPVPDPALPFLGIHLTRRVDGAVLVGPSAVPAFALEGYDRRTRRAADLADLARWPGTWRMARRQWRTGATELRRSRSTARFVAEAARYLPGLTASDVLPAPAGVRAQAVDRDGSLVDDFRITALGPITAVRNAPSPAATSSLAIAEHVVDRLLARQTG